MRKRGVKSPDHADAAVMTLAAPTGRLLDDLLDQINTAAGAPAGTASLSLTGDLLTKEM
jgi:hypothetical protein